MWARFMSWLGLAKAAEQTSRLDAAMASNLAAQGGLQQESEDTAASAVLARRKTVIARRRTRRTARQFDGQRMNTGDVRALVDGMLATFDPTRCRQEDEGR